MRFFTLSSLPWVLAGHMRGQDSSSVFHSGMLSAARELPVCSFPECVFVIVPGGRSRVRRQSVDDVHQSLENVVACVFFVWYSVECRLL